MSSCSAFGCTNRGSKKIPGITFHMFPKDPKRREEWTTAVSRKDWKPSKYSLLCSAHFSPECFDRTSLCYVRLRENVVPSKFEAFPSYLKKVRNSRKSPKERTMPDLCKQEEISEAPCKSFVKAENEKLPILRQVDDKESVQKQNKETHSHLLINVQQSLAGSTLSSTSVKNENHLYECLWDNCDCQFEDNCDLNSHLVMKPNGHIWQTFRNRLCDEFQCLWYNCGRFQNYIKPFPSIYHLIRHVKEVHLRTFSNDVLPAHQKNKEELVVIRSSQSDPITLDVETKSLIGPSVTQLASDYTFEGKCNFADMNVCAETTDGCNARIVLNCLCPTTKVIGMEYPCVEYKHPTSQIPSIDQSQFPLIDFPHPIKQELILPDDGTNPAFINPSSEPSRVEMTFCVDQDRSTPEPGSVPSDALTAMDVTESTVTTPNAFAHTEYSVQSQIRQLYTKYLSIRKRPTPPSDNDTSDGHLQTYSRPQKTMKMRELPNYPYPLQIGRNTTLRSPQIPLLQAQPVVTKQFSANVQSQQSGINQVELPIIDHSQDPLVNFPLVASIKQELIEPDDETNPSFINSSSEPTRIENIFSLNQDESAAKLRSVPSDTLSEELSVIRSSKSDPTTLDVETKPPIDPLVIQPHYVVEGKCRKCNFSDRICVETTDDSSDRIVLKCMLCPATKEIAMEYPNMKDKHPKSQIPCIDKSQVPLIDFPQVAAIKEELILPDDGTNPFFINSPSEPTKVENIFCINQDENAAKLRCVSSDTYTTQQ